MNLLYVTFTGADDQTDAVEMANLSNEFPFIEWGILFSKNNVGTGRYPSIETIEKILSTLPASARKSAHICGEWSRNIAEKGGLDYDDARLLGPLLTRFNRFQLNFSIKSTTVDIINLAHFLMPHPHLKVILQQNKSNEPFINAIAPYLTRNGQIQILFDASGGRGKEITVMPEPILNLTCGYAGGINPDNVEEKLKAANAAGGRWFWIDMEAGVRTNDVFDLAKVRQVCETVAKCLEEYGEN